MSAKFAQVRKAESVFSIAEGVVRLKEFREAAIGVPDLTWGRDPRGVTTIKINAKGDTGLLDPNEGFFLKDVPQFFPCYELNDGIAVDVNDVDVAVEKLRAIAAKLNSKVFFFD